jgi:hypothetical protein
MGALRLKVVGVISLAACMVGTYTVFSGSVNSSLQDGPFREQDLDLMSSARASEEKLLASIHNRESDMYGPTGILTTRFGWGAKGNAKAKSMQLAANDASSAHGGIDLSADSKLLAAGDAAIKKAEQDTGANPLANTKPMISKLTVKKPMKAVTLKSRRQSKQILDTKPDDVMLVAEPHTSKLLAEAEGISPAAKPQPTQTTALKPAGATKVAGGVPSMVVNHEGSDIKRLTKLMESKNMNEETFRKDRKKLQLAESLLMAAVKRMRTHPDQTPKVKEKELGLTIDALRLKRLEQALKAKLEDIEHKKLMEEHKKQMLAVQSAINKKRDQKGNLAKQLEQMRAQNAALKKQLQQLSKHQKQVEKKDSNADV